MRRRRSVKVCPVNSLKNSNESFVIYRSLKLFSTVGKLLGFFNWYVNEDGSLPNVHQVKISKVYKIFTIVVPWVLVHITRILELFWQDHKFDAVAEMNLVIINAVITVNLIAIDIAFGYCAFFSRRLEDYIRHWNSLDCVIGCKLPVRFMEWTQIIIISGVQILIIIRMVQPVELLATKSLNWIAVLSNIADIYYFILIYNWLFLVAGLFAMMCWVLSIAYAEITEYLKRSLSTRRPNVSSVVNRVLEQERLVVSLFSETKRVFTLHLTIITVQSSFQVCVFLYYFVNDNNYKLLFSAVVLFIPVMGITAAADVLKSQHRNLVITISDLDCSQNHAIRDDHVKMDLFKWKLVTNPVEFSAFGFFTLNRSLVTGLLGAIITYIVILTQLKYEAIEDVSECLNISSKNLSILHQNLTDNNLIIR